MSTEKYKAIRRRILEIVYGYYEDINGIDLSELEEIIGEEFGCEENPTRLHLKYLIDSDLIEYQDKAGGQRNPNAPFVKLTKNGVDEIEKNSTIRINMKNMFDDVDISIIDKIGELTQKTKRILINDLCINEMDEIEITDKVKTLSEMGFIIIIQFDNTNLLIRDLTTEGKRKLNSIKTVLRLVDEGKKIIEEMKKTTDNERLNIDDSGFYEWHNKVESFIVNDFGNNSIQHKNFTNAVFGSCILSVKRAIEILNSLKYFPESYQVEDKRASQTIKNEILGDYINVDRSPETIIKSNITGSVTNKKITQINNGDENIFGKLFWWILGIGGAIIATVIAGYILFINNWI